MRVRIFLVLLTAALVLHGGSLEAANPRVQGIGDEMAPVDQPGYALGIAPWVRAADLSAVAGKPVRFRFYLTRGSLYAFWVSPDVSGASHGYVAAGGPGFTGPKDTVGITAY